MTGLLAVGSLLWVTVWFDGVPVRCLVDTGSAVTLLSGATAARIGTMSPVLGQTMLTGAGGGTIGVSEHVVPNVGTTSIGWPQAAVLVADANPDESCILGTNLLGQQPLTFDWADTSVVPATAAAN